MEQHGSIQMQVVILPQEPQLDESLTVRENVELGLSHIKNLLTAYDAVNDNLQIQMQILMLSSMNKQNYKTRLMRPTVGIYNAQQKLLWMLFACPRSRWWCCTSIWRRKETRCTAYFLCPNLIYFFSMNQQTIWMRSHVWLENHLSHLQVQLYL